MSYVGEETKMLKAISRFLGSRTFIILSFGLLISISPLIPALLTTPINIVAYVGIVVFNSIFNEYETKATQDAIERLQKQIDDLAK